MIDRPPHHLIFRNGEFNVSCDKNTMNHRRVTRKEISFAVLGVEGEAADHSLQKNTTVQGECAYQEGVVARIQVTQGRYARSWSNGA